MFIKRIDLVHFRNYTELHLPFKKGINAIVGKNASGKTNLLEAIYYLSMCRSLKKAEQEDMIQNGEKFAQIRIVYEDKEREHTLQADISKDNKLILIDSEKQKTVSKLIGKLLLVSYSPISVNLFRVEPSERRKFLDTSLSLLSNDYLTELSKYKKLLKQRNNALNALDEVVIEVITEELIQSSYLISNMRKKFIQEIGKYISNIYNELFASKEKIKIVYQTSLPLVDDKEEYIKQLSEKFSKIKSEERKKKVTLLGIQKDDIIAYLDDKQVYSYCSQGQNRLAVLSLYLSFKEILERKYQSKPILLLDDVLSDLDEIRKRNLINYLLKQEQVFISLNEENIINSDINIIKTSEIVGKGEYDG